MTELEEEEISFLGICIFDEDAVCIIYIDTQTLKVITMVVLLKLVSDSMEDGKGAIQGKVMISAIGWYGGCGNYQSHGWGSLYACRTPPGHYGG